MQIVCSEEINGGNNYKEGRQDFNTRQGMWKGFRSKGQLSGRVNIGTDPLTSEYRAWSELSGADNSLEDWEEYISDEEEEEIAEITIIATRTPTTTRRIRPTNQTEAQKAAWDEKTRLLRNTRVREARLRKKLTASAVPAISSTISTSLTLSISF